MVAIGGEHRIIERDEKRGISFVLALAAVVPLQDAVKGEIAAVGADPSWKLQIGADTLTLTESIDDDEKIEDFKLVSSGASGAEAYVSKPISVIKFIESVGAFA